MDNQVLKYVTQERAALLLGIPEEELSRISSALELGHTERAGDQKETFFTYEELRQICLIKTTAPSPLHVSSLPRNPQPRHRLVRN